MSLGFKLGRSDKLWTLLSLPSSTIFTYIRWLVPGDPYLSYFLTYHLIAPRQLDVGIKISRFALVLPCSAAAGHFQSLFQAFP